jgi:hypothetical protein
MEKRDILFTIFSVVIITTTISSCLIGSFPVIGQELVSKTPHPIECNSPLNHIMYPTDADHQFAIVCDSTHKGPALWKLSVSVKASPQVLGNIQRVNYRAYKGFTCCNETNQIVFPNGTLSVNLYYSKNNPDYALNMTVIAGPRIDATVFFKDKEVRKYPTQQIVMQCILQTCPIVFTVNPNLSGQNLKLDGSEDSGNIVKIHVAWGDGSANEGHFPFMHKYSKAGLYTVTIAGTNNIGVTVSQIIQISTYLLENSIPKGLPGVSTNAYGVLIANTTASNIQEDAPISFIISGKLSSSNGSSAPNVPIYIRMYSVAHPELYNVRSSPGLKTGADGIYSWSPPTVTVDGSYKIIVEPLAQPYSTLHPVVKDLTVIPAPFNKDQLIQIWGIAVAAGVAVIALLVKIPSYITQVKQSDNLRNCIKAINSEYDRYMQIKDPSQIDKDRYLDALDTSRNIIMDFVASRNPLRSITVDQYNMLDDLVSRRISKIDNITPIK